MATQENLMSISIDNVTNDEATGTFDKLMKGVDKHINEQYSSNRINGSDYANVYLGSLQAALAQSIQFELQKEISIEQGAKLYAERVIVDKEAAKLGMDNGIKNAESIKRNDDESVYTPQYTKVGS